MTNLLKKNDQTGRSMVEMLGVLAIIGVLSVGGIAGYSKAMTKFKITKTFVPSISIRLWPIFVLCIPVNVAIPV